MSRARDVADTQDNIGGAVAPYVAAKNSVINGGMDFWQRGTSFSVTAGATTVYSADRWTCYFNGNGTITQDTSLVQTGQKYGLRVTATATSVNNTMYQGIETFNTLPLVGQTVTLSAWVAGTSGKSPGLGLEYSTSVDAATIIGTYITLSPTTYNSVTSSGTFQKLTWTFAIPSNAQTLRVALYSGSLANTDYLTWSRVQLELGSVATPFARAGGTIQGELAACQRYYFRNTGGGATAYNPYANGGTISTTGAYINFPFPVQMRVAPTAIEYSNIAVQTSGGTLAALSSLTMDQISGYCASLAAITGSSWTANQPCRMINNNNVNGYVGFTAEL